MLKKESTKLGYISDYKKDVDDIVDLLKGYPCNDEIKKNFLSSVVEMVEETMILPLNVSFKILKVLNIFSQINLGNYLKKYHKI